MEQKTMEQKMMERYKKRLEAERARNKRFYDRNKKIKAEERKKNTIQCACGGKYHNSEAVKDRHMKTKRHKKYQQEQVEDLSEDIQRLLFIEV